jgi:pimeloyl-ACP methyl ester carboxylesterase
MRRFVFRALLILIVIVLVAAAVGPLLIDPVPADGATDARTVAEPDSRFLDLPADDGLELSIHYLERPVAGANEDEDAPSFVLLHGFTFNAFTWNRLLDAFAEHGPTVAYDQLPYGLSSKLPAGIGGDLYSKAEAVDRLFGIMDALGMDRAILVGNSSGGTLALDAALARPERVEALILISPWIEVKRPVFPAWLAGLPQMKRLSLLLARYLGGETSPLLALSYADPRLIDDERRRLMGIHRQMANWDVAWAALLDRSLTDPVRVSERLAEVEQPVLLIAGAEDRVVPVEDTGDSAKSLPQADLTVLPDCGHVPQEECPELVEQVIGTWLDQKGF